MSVIYLDTASTTKIDSRVFDTMLPYFTELYGNASSIHNFGVTSKIAIDIARTQVSKLINSNQEEIIFTSGSTESINIALKGYTELNYTKGNHIITVKTEHKAVISTCENLEMKGYEVTYLKVGEDGLISLTELTEAIRPETILIAIMYVNNETGVIQPINEIGTIAKENDIIFFCDATQAVGKIPIDVQHDNIDMLSFSGHKLHAPKGTGVLYIRQGIEVSPLFHGGSQEKNIRPGTYNTPLIVGLGKACELASEELEINRQKVENNYKWLIDELLKIKGVKIIGSTQKKIQYIVNIFVPGLNAELFILKASDFAISNGAACTSQIVEGSHVLKAMGLSDQDCAQTLRLSIDQKTDIAQMNLFVDYLKENL
ncbi:cysteine desulfurase family protein [Chryseobacterium indoltheticum]|jgi:cysteine desulfurase|uniref:cysteine desulfurase family protein n=1 Tax=Chryseobacterium indoltheticum TaxID=254 RepID=UPI00242B89ED|nr:cysteine desulfurase family protein [Chryseobacterium indoltheticum]MDF2833021.1 IscS [Chryseobacterium indoltheticum]